MTLLTSLEAKRESRKQFEALKQWLTERRDQIRMSPPHTQTSFWCDSCQRDFDTTGYKQVRTPAHSVWFAYYVGLCPCGRHALRYITDHLRDPYFWKSKVVKVQQAAFADEMLQPWQPRFKQVFPLQYRALFEKQQGLSIT